MNKTINNIKLVKNETKYWESIRKLKNNPLVKKNSISQEYITKEQQKKYMKQNNDIFHICLLNDEFVGYIRILNDDIGLIVEPNKQRLGIGEFMVKEILKQNKNIIAKIKINNINSIKLFEKCGFKKKYYIYEPK